LKFKYFLLIIIRRIFPIRFYYYLGKKGTYFLPKFLIKRRELHLKQVPNSLIFLLGGAFSFKENFWEALEGLVKKLLLGIFLPLGISSYSLF